APPLAPAPPPPPPEYGRPWGLGFSPFPPPLLRNSFFFFFSPRLLSCFPPPVLPPPAYEFSGGSRNLPCGGLPHSEIPGSKPVCGSPRLIAACHVLHRFSAPRHSPSTLSSLTIKYLRRESFLSIYPTLLSKTVITSDQKVAPVRATFSSALPDHSPMPASIARVLGTGC